MTRLLLYFFVSIPCRVVVSVVVLNPIPQCDSRWFPKAMINNDNLARSEYFFWTTTMAKSWLKLPLSFLNKNSNVLFRWRGIGFFLFWMMTELRLDRQTDRPIERSNEPITQPSHLKKRTTIIQQLTHSGFLWNLKPNQVNLKQAIAVGFFWCGY